MNVGQFRKVLQVAQRMHRELGDEEAAKAIACFANLLKGSLKSEDSLRAFAESLQAGPKDKPRAKSRR